MNIWRRQKEFQWRGCSDDVNFGLDVVKSFVDSDVKTKTLRHRMQMHNSKIGQSVSCKLEVCEVVKDFIPFQQFSFFILIEKA